MADIFENLVDSTYGNATNIVRNNSGDPAGFTNLSNFPSASGSSVRQARIANERNAKSKRNIMKWFLPELGIVEMYINPNSIRYSDKKLISSPTRTRGGFNIQYWGEDLGTLSINGTTGSSGVEGINVLYDVYRNEQLAFDSLALAAEAAREREAETQGLLGGLLGQNNLLQVAGNVLGGAVNGLFDQVNSVMESGNVNPTRQRPTPASIAFQTELYWSGWVYRGYFNDFNVDEKADALGLFDYSITFTVTQKRGLRLNFMPWHRSAVNGPSNSDPNSGIPYSYATLAERRPIRLPQITTSLLPTSVAKALKSYRPL